MSIARVAIGPRILTRRSTTTIRDGIWYLPQNVFIELGIAIALNRPILLLRHAKNRDLPLPDCLDCIRESILEFSGEPTLRSVLAKHLPRWLNTPPEQDWWNRYCMFGDIICEYREVHPRMRQWGHTSLCCHISDSLDVDQPDFRGVIDDVLGRFRDVKYVHLNEWACSQDNGFRICAHCQAVRSTSFAIHRITKSSPAETFMTIGMNLALEKQFEYKIPKILLVENRENVPSLLKGYEVIEANSDKTRKDRLLSFIPLVLQKVNETSWNPRPLPFIDPKTELIDEEHDMKPGSIIEGSIIRIGKDGILVDIGLKIFGFVHNNEMQSMNERDKARLKVGNHLQIYVVRTDTLLQQVILSVDRIENNKRPQRVMMEDDKSNRRSAAYADKTLTCRDCGIEFVFTAG
jgi:predicted RNA-binding protein with RPS1 domain